MKNFVEAGRFLVDLSHITHVVRLGDSVTVYLVGIPEAFTLTGDDASILLAALQNYMKDRP